MRTNLYRRLIARGCALTQSVLANDSAAKQRLVLSILVAFGVSVFNASAATEWTPENQRDWAGVQAYIEVNNKPHITTDDIVRVLEIKGEFSTSKELTNMIAHHAYDDPHLSFSMTARDINRLKHAGATPDLIAAMKSPVSVARPPEVLKLNQPTRVANTTATKWTLEKTTALGGVAVADISDDLRTAIHLPKDVQGAVIAEIEAESPAAKAGLREGDVILGFSYKEPPKNAKDLVAMSKEFKPNETILLLVYTQGNRAWLALHPPGEGSNANAGGSAQGSWMQGNIELIIDASGSMAAKIGGRTKMDIAKQALTELLLSIPSTKFVSIRAYGHRKKDDCNDIELISEFNEPRTGLPAIINSLKPLGKTPLTASIAAAAKHFAGLEGQDNTIILITDGEETCNADPCAAAKAAHESGIKVKINVIGFKIDPKERAQLECIANAGGGKYVSANDAVELTAATKQVAQVEAAPAPAATANPLSDNILATANGGQLLVAPSDDWNKTIDGKEDYVMVKPGQEAVYAFKDEKPATFDRFATLVSESMDSNLKEFELLAGDESPTGTFRSIGTFTVQNAKMLKSPYQEFKFDPVTAKYLKVKVISNYGNPIGRIHVSEFKVFGQANTGGSSEGGAPSSQAGAKSAAVKKGEGTNLLAASAGGQVLVAPDDDWSKTIDGKEEYVMVKPGQEAVYAFKDEKPATFDRFATLVSESMDSNLKEFELLAGDESPTGTFRSIGTFTVQNAKMLKSPYQEFKFDPVTAKYLKVKVISNYGNPIGRIHVSEFKLFSASGGQ